MTRMTFRTTGAQDVGRDGKGRCGTSSEERG